MLIIKKVSLLTKKVNQMTLPITEEQFLLAEEAIKEGMLIQDAYPTLSSVEREFLLTGTTPQEWENFFE